MAKKNKPKSKKSSKSTSSKIKSSLPSFFYNTKMNCWLIMLFSFLIYGNTLLHDYAQDDAIVIYDNMYTTQGVKGIPGILKKDTFFGFFKKEGKDDLVAGGRYRPLTLIMYALEVQIFSKKKKDANGKMVFDPLEEKGKRNAIKFVGHFLTILLYGFTGVILYLLLLQILKPNHGENFALFVSLLATFIFMAHPLHTEVVANIKGRDEIVTLLGSLAALYFSIKGFYGDKKYNIWAGFLFFLALMAKENAITFLAIAPLTYYFFIKTDFGKIATQMIPFIIAAVVFLGIRTYILGFDFGDGKCEELMNCPYLKLDGTRYIEFTGGEKLATIIFTLGKYIQLLFAPVTLTHDYYPYHIDIMNFSNWKVLLSLFMYLGLGVYAIFGMVKKDAVAYGIIFYLTTLSIVSNIVFPVGTNMAERFIFMPSVGFSLVIAILGYRAIKYFSKNLPADKAGKKTLQASSFTPILGIAGIVILLFSIKTITRNFDWKNNETLFLTDIEVSQNSAKLRNSVGGTLWEKAALLPEGNERTNLANQAIVHLNKAVEVHPNYQNAYLLLGNSYQLLDQYDTAIQYYQHALKLNSDYDAAFQAMNIAYQNAGRFFGEKKGDARKAIQYLNVANQRQPNDPETLRLLGIATAIVGNTNQAIQYLEQALKVAPNNASVLWNLASALAAGGQETRASQLRQKALEIDPTIGQPQ